MPFQPSRPVTPHQLKIISAVSSFLDTMSSRLDVSLESPGDATELVVAGELGGEVVFKAILGWEGDCVAVGVTFGPALPHLIWVEPAPPEELLILLDRLERCVDTAVAIARMN